MATSQAQHSNPLRTESHKLSIPVSVSVCGWPEQQKPEFGQSSQPRALSPAKLCLAQVLKDMQSKDDLKLSCSFRKLRGYWLLTTFRPILIYISRKRPSGWLHSLTENGWLVQTLLLAALRTKQEQMPLPFPTGDRTADLSCCSQNFGNKISIGNKFQKPLICLASDMKG